MVTINLGDNMIFGKTNTQKTEDDWNKYSNLPYKKKFAWFPVPIEDGRMVWLEIYYVKMYQLYSGKEFHWFEEAYLAAPEDK
jgi:uncharacterized protein (DUF1919 family)